MIIQRHEPSVSQPDITAGLYVFSDLERPTHSVRHALAGPFSTAVAARLWAVQRLEAELPDCQREVWAKLSQRIGGLTADLGLELFLLEWVAKDKTFERLSRYVPRNCAVDHRSLAAGDREAA